LRFKGELNSKEKAKEIAHQLLGIGGRRSVGFGQNKIRSLPDAVAVAFSSHYDFGLNGNGKNHEADSSPGADICPSCGASAFVFEEGCSKCHNCGHSEC
jgi:ribonucleoside-diphosphate reductase alpha chain